MHHLSVCLLAMACLAGAASGSGDHSHGDEGQPEYLALYSLGVGGSHTLEFTGAGEETSIEFMVVPSSSADHEGLGEAEEASALAWEEFSSGSESPVSLLDGSSAVPSRAVVYTASLLSSATTTTSADEQVAVAVAVPLAVAEAGAYTLLLNHGEIPAAMVSPTGETLASVAAEDRYHEVHAEDEEEEEEEEEGTGNITASQWANALTASFLISLCSFVGIITVVSSRVARKINLSLAFLFASGALLTTAVVHIIPDAMDGLAPEYADDLHGLFLRSGIAVMAGIFGGFLLHVALDSDSGGGGGGGSHSHHSSALLHPLAAARPPRGDTNAATPPPAASEEAPLTTSRAGKGVPAPAAATIAAAAVGGDVAEVPSSSFFDGGEHGGGGGDGTAGAAPCRRSQGKNAEDCGEEDPRGCEGGGDMEEGRTQQQPRRRPRGDSCEVVGGVRKIAAAAAPATAPATSRPAERSGGGGAVLTVAGSAAASASLHDVKRLGADRGLFDVAGLDPVCWNVICGDLAHNFSDGVTMAAAFLGCSPTVGWTITAANMMHEIPHEVGNFMALVNGGMSAKQALLYNFFSALFAVFGVILTFSLRDLITQTAISYLLLLGAGTFIFVGLSELVPDALGGGSFGSAAAAARGPAGVAAAGGDDAFEKEKKRKRKSLHRRSQAHKALAFTVGAVLLGLPLLTHRHCEADGVHGHDHR